MSHDTSFPDLADLSDACRAAIRALSDGIQPADVRPLLRAVATGILFCDNQLGPVNPDEPNVIGAAESAWTKEAKIAVLTDAASGNITAKPLLNIFLALLQELLANFRF